MKYESVLFSSSNTVNRCPRLYVSNWILHSCPIYDQVSTNFYFLKKVLYIKKNFTKIAYDKRTLLFFLWPLAPVFFKAKTDPANGCSCKSLSDKPALDVVMYKISKSLPPNVHEETCLAGSSKVWTSSPVVVLT